MERQLLGKLSPARSYVDFFRFGIYAPRLFSRGWFFPEFWESRGGMFIFSVDYDGVGGERGVREQEPREAEKVGGNHSSRRRVSLFPPSLALGLFAARSPS